MFQLTDIGTNISAPMSVKVTVIPFSLFTAYQFLSSDRRLDAPESKMRPFPSCMYQWLCAYMMEMIATSFFFAYCVSNFECWFLFENLLDKAAIVSYNTTPAEEEWRCSLLCVADLSDHIVIISLCGVDHMCQLACLFSVLCAFLLCRRSKFQAHLPSENKTTYQSFGTRIWPHSWP